MSQDTRVTARTRLGQVLAFARSAEPRAMPSRRAIWTDVVLAACVLAAALALISFSTSGRVPLRAVAAVVVLSVPLAARRLYPLTALFVLLVGVSATRRFATDVTFLAIIFAAYSAVVYSRFRGAAQICVPLAGLVVAGAFWTATPDIAFLSTATAVHSGFAVPLPVVPPGAHLSGPVLLPGDPGGFGAPWRFVSVMVLLSLVLIAIVGNAVHAGDRIRRLQAEHEVATQRAIELERARIASELHDVVTHNVSVMIVQAGAARQIFTDSPDQARTALLAVESSGRAAMTELRYLLGLLSPFRAGGDGVAGADATTDGADLRPQPGLWQLRALIDSVSAAGVPIDLHVGQIPDGLPPGLDAAAFRVVQEGLTNVLKHAGKPPTSVRLDYRDGELVLEVADAGRPIPAASPAPSAGGRGLLGLRERTSLYGGSLDAGPRPGGGWLVRARIPVDPLAWPAPAAAAAPVAGPASADALARNR